MIKIKQAKADDMKSLVNTCVRAFHADVLFTTPEFPPQGPPGYDSVDWNLSMLEQAIYYCIHKEDEIVGGIILFDLGNQNKEFNLGRIWVDPYYQNQGIGQEAMAQMFKAHPDVSRWTLGTPSFAVRNQHFYEKVGFQRILETEIDPDLGWGSVEYERVIEI